MSDDTLTLTEFLLTRIAEDEEAARWAKSVGWVVTQAPGWGRRASLSSNLTGEALNHIVRHAPARVLAECAAKRAVVEATTYYARYLAEVDLEHDILRALSSVYSAHADFRPEWRS